MSCDFFFFFLLSFLCLSISGASAGDGVCPCLNHSGQDERRKEWVKHDGVSFCWFKDPEAEGKRELENDRIRESELEGVILESFHSWLEVPTPYSKFLSPVWYLYGGSFYYKWYKVQLRLVKWRREIKVLFWFQVKLNTEYNVLDWESGFFPSVGSVFC